jgi:hypothetical protein
MKPSVFDRLIEVYFFVDEFLKKTSGYGSVASVEQFRAEIQWRRSLTIVLIQGYLGCATLI